jgi:hypothetical protein
VVRFVLAIAIVAWCAAGARAESPHLAEARAALDGVKYDDAQRLLVAALAEGGNRPGAVAEIYELSAQVAIVLGQRDAAEQYYRRMLAVAPDAVLADDLAPKLREPFAAAQAYMAAHGRLAVAARRDAAGTLVIDVTDPLAMAANAGVVAAGVVERLTLVDRRATTTAAAVDEVVVLDEHGNRLVVLPATAIVVEPTPVPGPGVAPIVDTTIPPKPRRVPIYRRWLTWAIPTVVAAGVGLGFGLDARSADADLRGILANSGDHTLQDATDARDHRDRSALVANLAFGAAGALAVVTTIVFVTRPHTEVHVVPTATTDGVGAAIVGSF